LARTELAHIQTQAARQRYEDTGIEYVEIWADKDERRCEVCGKLHQKRYPVGAQIPIPAHPRCRCTIVPVVEIPEDKPVQQPQQQQTPKTEQQTAEMAQPQTIETRGNPNVNNERLEKVFKKKAGTFTIEQDAAATNPNYNKGINYQQNCSHTVAAYEMRCRGFDVAATPAAKGDKYMAAGVRAWGFNNHASACASGDVHYIAAKRTAGIAAEIENALLKDGDGARYEIRVGWKSGGGHFFIGENHNGKVRFIDPQSGQVDDEVAEYFTRSKPSGTWWIRIDNRELDPDIMKELCE
jgi:hypothetical protein